MTTITLNGQTQEVPEGMTVLEAARMAGIDIPTLCHHEALGGYGACRVCVVWAEGPAQRPGLVAACMTPVSNGLAVQTESAAVESARRVIFQLLLGRSPESESLRAIAKHYGVTSTPYGEGARPRPVRAVRPLRARLQGEDRYCRYFIFGQGTKPRREHRVWRAFRIVYRVRLLRRGLPYGNDPHRRQRRRTRHRAR